MTIHALRSYYPVGQTEFVTVELNCLNVILNELTCIGSCTLWHLRYKCNMLASDHSIENVNAAINDLLNKFVIMQVAIDTYDLC